MAYMKQLEILIHYLEPGNEFAIPIAKTYNSWLVTRPNGKPFNPCIFTLS